MARLTKSSYAKIVLVILLCLLICGTLTGGFAFIHRAIDSWSIPWEERYAWTPEEGDSTGSFTVDATSVHDISINWLAGSASVMVVPDAETGGAIQVTETSDGFMPLRWRNSGGDLQIDYGDGRHGFGCSWFRRTKDLTVLVPQSKAASLGSFDLNAASGEYALSSLSCEYLTINLASGKVTAEDFAARNASFAVASGTFDYSGDILGTLELDQASGHSAITLASADPAIADLSMASGHLTLSLPSPDFQLGLSKISGNFDSDFEMASMGDTYYGQGDEHDRLQAASRISMDMISGNFKIEKSR